MKYDNLLNNRLESEIDEKFATFSRKIMQTDKLLGVKVPILRKIAREFSNYDDFYNNVSLDNFEQIAVAGFYIGQTTKDYSELKKRVDYILPHINNWGNCDIFVSSIKLLKTKSKLEFLTNVFAYLKSSNEYTVRFGIVCLLDYYLLDEKLTDEIFKKIIPLQDKTYYIDMAIAWLVSVSFVKFKDITIELLKSGKLIKSVQNKSISKICDSFRVSKEDKDFVKTLKIK